MPIIDGYKATHIIRRHEPYMAFNEDVPVIAMTASAIEGDRDKCKRAGMDDYLSKPVKGKTLERMLVKWSIQKRVPNTPSADSSSRCDQNINHEYVEPPERPPLSRRATRPNFKNRAETHSSMTEVGGGSRNLSREDTEEKATLLRDEKLIDAATPEGKCGSVPPRPETSQTQKLTIENVERMEKEQEQEDRNRDDAGPSSIDVENPQDSSPPARLKKEESGDTEVSELDEMLGPVSRPALRQLKGDSEMTITKAGSK